MKNIIIAKNASILLITDIISKVLQTVLAIVIARKLGASELGLLKYAIAFAVMFSFIPNFGFNNFINREVAKNPELSGIYFSNLSVVKFLLSIITFLIIFVSSYITKSDYEQLIIICYAAGIMLINSFIQFYTAFFRGFQKAEYEAIILISENILFAVTGILIITLGRSLRFMMMIRFAVTVLIFIAGFIILKMKILKTPYRISASSCISLIKSATPFTILTILIIVNTQVGIVLLTNMKGTDSTGLYIAALNLCGVFQFLSASVAGAILPAMTKFAKENNRIDLENTFSKSIKYLLILVLPIAAGTTVIADKIILLIYGVEFTNSIITLRILIWVVVFSFANTIFNVAFLSIDKEKIFVRIQILVTIIYLSLCFTLIPIFGHNGVAFAYTFSQCIIFVIAKLYFAKYLNNVRITSILFKLSVAASIMVISTILIRTFPLIFIILVACVVYATSLIILKIFDQNELNFMKEGIAKLSHVFAENRI